MIHGPALHDKHGIDLQRIFYRCIVSDRNQRDINPGMVLPLLTVCGQQKYAILKIIRYSPGSEVRIMLKPDKSAH